MFVYILFCRVLTLMYVYSTFASSCSVDESPLRATNRFATYRFFAYSEPTGIFVDIELREISIRRGGNSFVGINAESSQTS